LSIETRPCTKVTGIDQNKKSAAVRTHAVSRAAHCRAGRLAARRLPHSASRGCGAARAVVGVSTSKREWVWLHSAAARRVRKNARCMHWAPAAAAAAAAAVGVVALALDAVVGRRRSGVRPTRDAELRAELQDGAPRAAHHATPRAHRRRPETTLTLTLT